jgi:DNA repair photolyase
LNAGIDFETKIVVKPNAPGLFCDFLAKKSWVPESISRSGVTDGYQPAERHFELTRGCLTTTALGFADRRSGTLSSGCVDCRL